MSEPVRGRHLRGRGRKPRRFDADRVCRSRGCSTRLSTYNRSEFCHVHAPARFPRVRGRVVPDA
jgi:hypothetical protein